MLSLKFDSWPRLGALFKVVPDRPPEGMSQEELRAWSAAQLELKRQKDEQVQKSLRYRHFI